MAGRPRRADPGSRRSGAGRAARARPRAAPSRRRRRRPSGLLGPALALDDRVQGQPAVVPRCAAATAPAGPSAPAAARTTAGPRRPRGRKRSRRSRPARRPPADPVGLDRPRRGAARAQSAATCAEAVRAAGDDLARGAQRRRARSRRVGLLPAEPAVRGAAARRAPRRDVERVDRDRGAGEGAAPARGGRAPARRASSLEDARSVAAAGHGAATSPAWPAGSRPRPCAPSRSARAGGSCARRPRSCRRCR